MNDLGDLRESVCDAYQVDNYSIFVRHFDNWINELADRYGALGKSTVVEKLQESIKRNAKSNAYHYTALAEKHKKDGDEALAEHSRIVASAYRSIAEE